MDPTTTTTTTTTPKVNWAKAEEAYMASLSKEEENIIQECKVWISAYNVRCTNGFLQWFKKQDSDFS